MTALLIDDRETDVPYAHVVSDTVVRDVASLIDQERTPGGMNSIVLTQGKDRPASILELRGLGREVWEGVDPQAYINELRNEWSAH
jgi:hypothetical protein